MTTTTLRVEQAGRASVQDLGRPGYGRLGVSVNGAGDAWSASVASVLVGNQPGTPLLETTGSGLRLRSDRPVLLAVTGAVDHVLVEGHRQPAWQPLVVPAGGLVEVPAPDRGLRSYLAVAGRLRAGTTLGSVAPDPLLGVGTWLGAGDRLVVRTRFDGLHHPHSAIPLFRFAVPRPAPQRVAVVDVTPGPEAGEFDEGALASAGDFEVAPDSDHVGLRLTGDAPRRTGRGEILSRGVPVGAVQVPPSGGLAVLMRGRLVTAGYPVLGVATTAAVDLLAQLRPGDRVRFRPCGTADGVAALRRRNEQLADLERRVGAAFAAAGLASGPDGVH